VSEIPARIALTERFVIDEEPAHHGGIGNVHLGRDLATGDAVAIKVVRNTAPGEHARLVREAELLSRLDHEAIVRHVAHGRLPNGESFLVMPWLEGESLAGRLARSALSVTETLTLAQRAARALNYTEGHGLVHGDITPANLFVVGNDLGATTLIDFGTARSATGKDESDDVASERIDGTLGYMAPEQARGDRDIDTRADIFALGCVLYKCLAGRAPFACDNPTAVLAKTLFENAPSLVELCENVPRALEQLIARMLSHDARLRPGGGSQLQLELANLGIR
jgi:eukaryotic-like serine/threonine-protein kinase